MTDWDEFFRAADGRKRSFDCKHAVFAKRGLDFFRIGPLGEQEFPIVFPVHALAVRFLLVLRMNLKKNYYYSLGVHKTYCLELKTNPSAGI